MRKHLSSKEVLLDLFHAGAVQGTYFLDSLTEEAMHAPPSLPCDGMSVCEMIVNITQANGLVVAAVCQPGDLVSVEELAADISGLDVTLAREVMAILPDLATLRRHWRASVAHVEAYIMLLSPESLLSALPTTAGSSCRLSILIDVLVVRMARQMAMARMQADLQGLLQQEESATFLPGEERKIQAAVAEVVAAQRLPGVEDPRSHASLLDDNFPAARGDNGRQHAGLWGGPET